MKKYGKILDSDSLILRVGVGEATGKDGTVYDLTTDMSSNPIIESGKTGKYFILSWADIISMAIEAGIDD